MKKILASISMVLMMLMNVGAATAQTSQSQPMDNYGFLNAPDGSTWTYTASFEKEYGDYTMVTLAIYNDRKEHVGTIVDSLKLDSTMIAINQAEINPLVTKQFFNNDDKYELMLFLHAQTKNYEGKFFNHVFSIAEGDTVTEPVITVEGRQIYAQNTSEFNENYVMIFARDSASGTENYTLCYDIRRKAAYGDKDGIRHTFRVPYANVAAQTDLQPIFMVQSGYDQFYVLQQYEKPYFDPNTPLDQDPVVNPDNYLVITFINKIFKTVHTTKIPVTQDENQKLLYTFPMLGGLDGADDILLNYDGTKPAYIITKEKYNLESDGSITSFYKYDVDGNELNTIAENTLGRIKMSPIVGQEEQWMFMKAEYDGEFFFVDLPSCTPRAEISVYLNESKTLSSQIDRYPKGDSYEYVVALLQGNNEEDGTISQDIAWLNADGSFNRYEKINLGKYIEAAQVNITADALHPWVIHTDDAREYMVLVKRYNPNNTSDKETAFLVCNTKGEILLDYGKDEEKGELNMVYLMDKGANPSILCVYQKNGVLTMHYTPLPLNNVALQGAGTAKDPYKLTCSNDFKLIDKNPSAYYEVANDIDFLSIPFDGPKRAFTGKLDGKNHTLTNLCLMGGGLLREVKDSAEITNIQFEDPILLLSEEHMEIAAGILANSMQGGVDTAGVASYALLSNVHVANPVIKAAGYKEIIGTIVGYVALNTDVNTCSVTGADIVAPSAQVGGVIGKSQTYSQIHACLFTGSAAGKVVGGITSEVSGGEPVYDCRVDADLYGTNTIGGIVGHSGRSKIYNNIVSGILNLADSAKVGKVGGIIGHVDTDATGTSTDMLAENCLVALSEINVPEGKDVIAHRVIGFSSGDDYEYDWDKVDWNKPQSEWPRAYFAPEKNFKNNYVVSDLAALDANVQQTDTTTEGATLAWSEVTVSWLGEKGYQFGNTVDAPWVKEADGMVLWYEDFITTDVENIGGCEGGNASNKQNTKKIFVNGQLMLIRNGEIYNLVGARVR